VEVKGKWEAIVRANQASDDAHTAFFGTDSECGTVVEEESCSCPGAPASLSTPHETCGLDGPIGGPCGCDYGSVNRLNREHINPLVREIVQQPFFSYFKVDLHCSCPLWADDSLW